MRVRNSVPNPANINNTLFMNKAFQQGNIVVVRVSLTKIIGLRSKHINVGQQINIDVPCVSEGLSCLSFLFLLFSLEYKKRKITCEPLG